MLSLTRLSLRNRALIALVTICAAVFGIIGTSALKQELFPPLELPQAFVSAEYEGASPEAVEREVTAPLEEALTGVEEVESIQSTSSSGSSQVIVETDYGTDSDDVVRSLQRAVSQVQAQMPDGVEPSVMSGGLADFPIVMLSVSGPEDVNQLASDLEDVAIPELNDIEGVRSATVTGDRPLQVNITVREDDLEDEGVSVDSLAGLLQANGVPSSPGQLESDEGSAPVEVGSRLTSVDQISELVVGGSDGPVPVSDVADVELVEAPASSISRTNGDDSLMLQVMKTPDGNTVEVSHGVEEALAGIQETMGDDVEFVTLFDQAPFIEQSIEDLLVEGLLGLGFAVLVILVFLLSVRATIITAISIPASLLITLIGLWVSGYTLNMLTLAALTISIGRVVDDSIVVVEAIRRRHSLGGDKAENIRAAVGEVATAITASTLVTVAVFLPVAFVGGQTGELFRPFALTASLALIASLFVALTIVPVLAYWFLSRRGKEAKLTRDQKRAWKSDRRQFVKQWRQERRTAAKRPVDASNPSGRRSTFGTSRWSEPTVPTLMTSRWRSTRWPRCANPSPVSRRPTSSNTCCVGLFVQLGIADQHADRTGPLGRLTGGIEQVTGIVGGDDRRTLLRGAGDDADGGLQGGGAAVAGLLHLHDAHGVRQAEQLGGGDAGGLRLVHTTLGGEQQGTNPLDAVALQQRLGRRGTPSW